MDFRSLVKDHFRRVFTAVAEPLAMVFDELCEPRFRYRAMRSFKGLPNLFATSKSAGIIVARLLMLEKISVFLPMFSQFCTLSRG
jgi:hypothetical protein